MIDRTQFLDAIENPLAHFLDHGVAVIPTLPSGATVGSWKDPANFTTDRDVVTRHWAAGIHRFQFLPEAAGFLCLDIDRKNGKNGLAELYRIFTDTGLAPPTYLLAINTFPAQTATPSGGWHLYFRYRGHRRYTSSEIAPGLEAIHCNHLLTAPGSEKDGKPYRFSGDLHHAPPLPPVLEHFLTPYREAQKPKTVWAFEHEKHGPLSLDDIAGIIARQGEYSPGSSRNRYVYEIAKFAHRKGYGPLDVEEYIRARFEAPDFDAREIAGAVRSAFKR